VDATRLRAGLSEYVAALDRQLVEMREERHRLDATWRRTEEVYQGAGAEAFRDPFGRSMTMLDNHVRMLEPVTPILKQTLEALKQFDSPTLPEL
jgi:hypothetical protein